MSDTVLNQLLKDSVSFDRIVKPMNEEFETPFYTRFLNNQLSPTLVWAGIVQQMYSAPAASFIDYSGDKPLRSRPEASSLSGKIPSLGNKYTLSAEDNENISVIESNLDVDGIDNSQIIDLLYPHLNRLASGPDKSIDLLFLEYLSNGTMTVDKRINPQSGGIEIPTMDWGVDKQASTLNWSDVNSDPLEDFKNVKRYGKTNGKMPRKAFMSWNTYQQMIATNAIKNAFGLEIKTGNKTITKQNYNLTVDEVNIYLASQQLPQIEIVEHVIPIEDDNGKISYVEPFKDGRVAFIQDENQGAVKYTIDIEEKQKDPNCAYAKAGNVLMITEYKRGARTFESKLSAFPVVSSIHQNIILVTNGDSIS